VDLTKDPLRISAQDASQSAPVANPTLAALGLTTSMVSFKTLVVALSKGATTPGANGVTITGVGLPSEVPIFLSGCAGDCLCGWEFRVQRSATGRHTLVRFISSMQPPQALSVVSAIRT
jgi:hypothetical protein